MDRSDFKHRSLLLDEVKSYLPSRLRPVETRVTRVGGGNFIESKDTKGSYLSKVVGGSRSWFVGDLKPDMQVGVILPGLLVGSQDVAQELPLLRSFGVTHVLNLATAVPNFYPNEIIYKRLDVRDLPTQNIKRYFDECFNFIDEGRNRGWVFVHCNAGISRAGTIVVGYLMSRQRMRLQEALRKAREARRVITPNRGFMQQLMEYEKELFGK